MGQFGVRLKVVRPSGPSNLEVAVDVFPAVAFRSEFQETLANRIFGEPVLPERVFPLGTLTAEPNGDYIVSVPATLGLRDGVHPVRVELRDRDDLDVVDEFVTHLVYLAGEHPGPKLGVSIVLPIHAQPALQPDGTRTRPGDAQLAGLSLAIDSARALPVSFVPTPETVAALVASNDPRAGAVLTSLRQADDRFVIGGPYVPVSLPALITAGLDGEVARQLNRGTTTLTEVLRAQPADHVWVAEEPLDAASLDVLAGRGVRRVVAAEAGLTPIPDQLITLTGPFQLDGERSSVEGAAADAGLSAHFDSQGNPALQAAHFLADLAVLYLDLPGEQRGVVALAPRTWQPDRVFLDAVVAGLAGHPVVEAVALDTLFATVPPATDLGEPLVRRPAVDPGGSLAGGGGGDPRRPGPPRQPGLRPRADQRGVGRPRRAPPGGAVGRLPLHPPAGPLPGGRAGGDRRADRRDRHAPGPLHHPDRPRRGDPGDVPEPHRAPGAGDRAHGERQARLPPGRDPRARPHPAQHHPPLPRRGPHDGRLPHPDHPRVAGRTAGGGPGPADGALDGGVGGRPRHLGGAALFLALWWGRHAQRGRRARR